jgi:hypothetical protein
MPDQIKPSEVKKPLMGTPWQNSERETVATNILKLSRFKNGDSWKPFSWADYVSFCSHEPIREERDILDEFAEEGYLKKDSDTYSFTKKIIDIYVQYTD